MPSRGANSQIRARVTRPARPRANVTARRLRSETPLALAASSWRGLGRASVFSAIRLDMRELLGRGRGVAGGVVLLAQQRPDVVAVGGEVAGGAHVRLAARVPVEVDGDDLLDPAR